MSFSYMTSVINDNFEQNGNIVEDFIFDPEGYDFILSKSTFFTDGNQNIVRKTKTQM
jgi:hypothetical protein